MSEGSDLESRLVRAAEVIRQAEALLIGAGAGMGVDSGLPDFRGPEGFWRAYPLFGQLGKRFEEMSNPAWFHSDPELAWGFFGHRMNLYRATQPHEGFAILRGWAERCREGYFVFTSNVDGHFEKAGFHADQIVECHGSIHFLQCAQGCGEDIWSSDGVTVDVDAEMIRATSPLPACPGCSGVARPNILMFGDWSWHEERTEAQLRRYRDWLARVKGRRLALIEFGAGTAVPTVRYECERRGGQLIRINPRDPDVPRGGISLPLGALEAVRRIEQHRQTYSEAC